MSRTLSTVLLVALLPGAAFGAPGIVVGNDTVFPGEAAEVSITWLGDGSGVNDAFARIFFNSTQLTGDSSNCGRTLGTQPVTCNLTASNRFEIVGGTGSGLQIPTGSLGTLRFTVSPSAPPGVYVLNVTDESYFSCVVSKNGGDGKGFMCNPRTPSGTVDGSITVLAPPSTEPAIANDGDIDFSLCPGDSDFFDLDFTETGGDIDGTADCALATGAAFSISPADLNIPAGTTRSIRITATAPVDGAPAVDQLNCTLDDEVAYTADLMIASAATPVTVSIGDAEVSEGNVGTRLMTFTATAPATIDCPFSIPVSTAFGTAGEDDFLAASSSLVFDGSAMQDLSFAVTVFGDDVVEPDEIFTANLGTPSQAFATIADGSGTGTIRNDDMASISIDDAATDEGDDAGTSVLTFALTLDAPVAGGVDVNWETADGTALVADGDYLAESGTVSFDGNRGEQEMIAVQVNGDGKVELDEAFRVVLADPPPTAVELGRGNATGTLRNDDAATLRAGGATATEGSGSPALLSFPVTLDAAVDAEVSVAFATADGTATEADGDFLATDGTLFFPAGAAGSQTVEVTLGDDAQAELSETLILALSALDAAGRDVILGDATAVGTILDDDGGDLVLLPPLEDLAPDDLAGTSVSVTPTGAAVGVPGADGEAGLVLVYDFPDGRPVLLAELPAPGDAVPGFGQSVSMHGDLLLVGTRGTGAARGFDADALTAALYRRLGASFQQLGSIKASQAAGGGQVALAGFGASLALVGSPVTGTVSAFQVGAGGVVPLGAPISGPPTPKGGASNFGAAIGAFNDKFAVGAPGPVGGAVTGSVSLYGVVSGNLQPLGTIQGTTPTPGGNFGASVAVLGSMLAIGAPAASGGTGFVELYSFPDPGAGVAAPTATIPAPAGVGAGAFGASLALDGDLLHVGAPATGGVGALFTYQLGSLLQSFPAPTEASAFGAAVGAAAGTFVVGAPQTDGAAGAAYISLDILFADGFETAPLLRAAR